jgi:phosphate transport system substrate-binding protein
MPAQQVAVDPGIAPYQKVDALSGNASSIGSDTMNNLMALWLERFRRYSDAITAWGQVGLIGEWTGARISLYGPNSASGTYGFFKGHGLYKGDYKAEVKEQPGSVSVVQGVTEDRFAVGYSGIGYRTSGVWAVPLATGAEEPYREGTLENVVSGRYPLSRFLLLYGNKAPNQPLDPMMREFCRFIFSREGQQIVIKDGYLPAPYEVAQAELAKLAA